MTHARVRRDRNSVASVEKAMGLLVELARARRPLLPSRLAELSGISQTGVYRLLRALEKTRAVERLSSGEYVLGFLTHELSTAFDGHARVKLAAAGAMLELRETCGGETVGLYARVNIAQFACIETLPGHAPVRHAELLYRPIPIAHGGTSLVLLADTWNRYGQAFVERYLCGLRPELRPEPVSEHLKQIERVRDQGYAVSHGRRVPGVSAVSAPLQGEFGQLLAILTLSAPTARLNDVAVNAWQPKLMAAAGEVAASLRARTFETG
ncbi:DNA-binding IclR family transcriptional regulator [Kibdelosporangium banguiense]|uniref:DNA-binding IclR family transcriptional regulator n=1 Tax=Kibdelosporangium banguiense TaxID=1365924 RepID=A0ABS4TY13_9PSEU|nr:IclR family transcriptional regulator C-terminal domain-containing protein [Kibdelosporangium banguiense]MBP2329269.1 DNA-binding IclR family transcriptional regulator [Kibdelosporangium banguiense]